ncbi:unnamed protein product, partial [Laminaria digitata]
HTSTIITQGNSITRFHPTDYMPGKCVKITYIQIVRSIIYMYTRPQYVSYEPPSILQTKRNTHTSGPITQDTSVTHPANISYKHPTRFHRYKRPSYIYPTNVYTRYISGIVPGIVQQNGMPTSALDASVRPTKICK